MTSLQNTLTLKHLTMAYMDECNAVITYTRYAKIARKEGYRHLAEQWQILAEQESAHASTLFKLIDCDNCQIENTVNTNRPGKTVENLRNAIAGETHEHREMYPEFANVARAEGFDKIADKFDALAVAEGHHMRTLTKFLQDIENNTMFASVQSIDWLCLNCGFIHHGTEAPGLCPACDHPTAHFNKL